MRKEIQNTTFEKHFNDFETYILGKAYSGNIYLTPVKEFLIWLEQIGIDRIKQVTSAEMLRYYEYLIERPNQRRTGTLAGSTIKSHLLVLSMFLENLLLLGDIQKGFVIPRFSACDQKPREVLTVDEIKLLYQNTDNLFEHALLSIAYGCGLRRSELKDLNMSDVQLSLGMLIVKRGKGKKRREVPMSDKVLRSVKRYIQEYRCQFLEKDSNGAFFLNQKGKRTSGDRLNKTLRKIIERTDSQSLNDKVITLHCLRHSIAHHLMEKDAGIDFIKNFLGHSFINTAYIYAKKNKQSKIITSLQS